jgi:glutamate-ammonia-ligase adenylyltransferase
MHISDLPAILDDPAAAETWLRRCGLHDTRRAHGNLLGLATHGITLDLLADMCGQLAEHLPLLPDADMALNNLERFTRATRNPLSLASLFERDREALPILLRIFSTSQHLSDVLITDSESYDLLRMTDGQPVAREPLVDELVTEVESLNDDRAVLAALRRFKRRETLRIAYGDIIHGQSLRTVTAQISHLADAILEAAVRSARRALEAKRGRPMRPDGRPARFVALAMGKLGGVELNYSSDIDLVFLYDQEGQTEGPKSQTNGEFFDRLAREIVRLLTAPTELGYAYRVDLRLRPQGETGPMVPSLESALGYYDVLGRTWERQTYVKARPAAGDLDLGHELLTQLEPWVYRSYLSLADIAGIKALKRRIEQRTIREGADARDVKTGHGGIRDIEFVIQFLQLLNGCDLPELRTGNTLEAIARLEQVGCLTHQERTLLEENYSFLRKIEHRLQIMFDLQTHLMPEAPAELRKLAIRMGYAGDGEGTALAAFDADYRQKTDLNRKILDHLLHDAFGDDAVAEPEVDLVLDPDPDPARVIEVLGRYGFREPALAYKHLMGLATEKIRFLSTRRCRHFLASIAPRLLKEIAATPDPDSTLVNLDKVSDSLGGKGVLWELFSFSAPSLRLYVELCAYSPYLSGILVSNPGMLDELMDSLVLNKLPKLDSLRRTLADLCRAAEDIDPILHSFKNTQQLGVGVRDILGKEDVRATTAALSDIAQACLEQIILSEQARLIERMGEPRQMDARPDGPDLDGADLDEAAVDPPPPAGEAAAGEPDRPCELIVLALGKFGGGELNYHSDLDLVFLYEGDGQTVHARRGRRTGETTSNQHFFSELGQRIIKTTSHLGPQGRLYEVDARLRPTGRSGLLATSLAEFARYFASGEGQLWERQALCKARVVFGSPRAAERAMGVVAQAAYGVAWRPEHAQSIRSMRARLEEASTRGNIKRGRGGMVDIEFLVQMLQLRHGGALPLVRKPHTRDALAALRQAGCLSQDDFEFLDRSYGFLRTIEARLRLMNATARDDLPEDPVELTKLARQMGLADGSALLTQCQRAREEVRARFERMVAEAAESLKVIERLIEQ